MGQDAYILMKKTVAECSSETLVPVYKLHGVTFLTRAMLKRRYIHLFVLFVITERWINGEAFSERNDLCQDYDKS
jgi:hypothetical protein